MCRGPFALHDHGVIRRTRRFVHEHNRVVVFADHDDLVAGANGGVHRRIDPYLAISAHHAHHRRHVIGRQRLAIALADQARLFLEINFGTVEVEQFGVDHTQPGLAAGLRGDARDQVFTLDEHRFVAADQSRGFEVSLITDLADDVIRVFLAIRIVGNREHRLDHVDVRVVLFGREHDDRTRGVRTDHVEVVEIKWIAAAADDAGAAGADELGLDVVFHLDLVAVREDDDARLLLVRVGDDQLADDRIDLVRPAEDQRVSGLDHARTALAQFFQPRLQTGGDGADQDAHQEDAGDGHHQHQQTQRPAGIVGQVAGVQRMHQSLPCGFDQSETRRRIVRILRDADQRQYDRRDRDDDRGHQRQPGDDRDCTFRQGVFEAIAQTVAPSDGPVRHRSSPRISA